MPGLLGVIEKVGTAKSVASSELDSRWVTVAFTWNGLSTLGVDESSLANFPEEFQQGMAARAGIVGTTGTNHPDHWGGGLASPDLHAIVIPCMCWRASTLIRTGPIPLRRRATRSNLVLVDSTHFTTLFGGTDSLKNLWRNLAMMK